MIDAAKSEICPQRYTPFALRLHARRQALDALRSERLKRSYGTKHVTNPRPERVPFSQVTEKNGGDDGTRTRDLCRDRAAF